LNISSNNYLLDLFQDNEDMENKILSDLSLHNIINTETLQQIQHKLAEFTEISMVTVDYKGNPITKESCFSEFCKLRREVTSCKQNCFFSDAYGGLKAAMSNQPYIYSCPAGLVDCAVPIVINGQHLGAVLMGQVRVTNADHLENLGLFIKDDINIDDHKELQQKYLETTIIDLKRLEMVADLAHFLVNEMVEKQLALRVERELKKENNRLLSENVIKENMLKEYKKIDFEKTGIELAPNFLISVMESINNLSIIEGADKTNEMVHLFTKILQFNYRSNSKLISLEKEIEMVHNFLLIRKMQMGDTFTFDIDRKCEIQNHQIPPLLLFPFIDNAIVHGIQHHDNGKVSVSIQEKGEDICVCIQDNGKGISKEILHEIYGTTERTSKKPIGLNINHARKRMIQLFGKKYDILMDSILGKGTTVTIMLPKEMKEEYS